MIIRNIALISFLIISANAFAYDGYNSGGCTVDIKGKIVKLIPSLIDGGCFGSQSNSRFVSVRMGDGWNVYDKEEKRLVLTRSLPGFNAEIYFGGTNYHVGDYNRKPAIFDKRSGIILYNIEYASSVYGPYGDDNVVLFSETGGNCKIGRIGKKGLIGVIDTNIGSCYLPNGYRDGERFVTVRNEKTLENYTIDLGNYKALAKSDGVDASALRSREMASCGHIYVGKVFSAVGGVFYVVRQDYEVLGFSSKEGKATVRGLISGHKYEVNCAQIPQ